MLWSVYIIFSNYDTSFYFLGVADFKENSLLVLVILSNVAILKAQRLVDELSDQFT